MDDPLKLSALHFAGRTLTGNRWFTSTDELRGANFHNSTLKNVDFELVDLTGADFSSAKLQSVNFLNSSLRQAKFNGAVTSLSYRWLLLQGLLIFIMAVLSGILPGFSGKLLTYYFPDFWNPKYFDGSRQISIDLGISLAYVIGAISGFWAIIRYGFTRKAGIVIVIAMSIVVIIASASMTMISAIAGLTSAISVAVTLATLGTIAVVGNIVVVIIMTAITSCFVGLTSAEDLTIALVIASIVAITGIALGFYINYCVKREDERFNLIRDFSIFLGSIGGTSFSGSDLTDADFSGAALGRTQFQRSKEKSTILERTNFIGSKQLERARPGEAIWGVPKVRKLLVNPHRKSEKDYSGLMLRGAYLDKAHLNGANLKNSDLSSSILTEADLQCANLTEVQLIGADLTGAYLTKACIEAWNIDGTTILENIKCDCIFQLEYDNTAGHRDRRPHNPDKSFQPGDFEKYYKELNNTIQLLVRRGTTPEALKAALQQLDKQYGITPSDMVSTDAKDNDLLLTFQPTHYVDKAAVEETFDAVVALQLKGAEEKGRILGRDEVMETLKLMSHSIQVNMQNNQSIGDNTVAEQKNQSIPTGANSFVNTGDLNMTGSTINLGTISGHVTNAIGQIPESSDSQVADLKEILTELQTAIESDSTLSDDDKAEALGQVVAIANAGKTPKDNTVRKVVKNAIKFIKGTISDLPDTEKVVQVGIKVFPLLIAFFGLT